MARVLAGGALYFAPVFVAAFIIGTARMLMLEPAFGASAAAAIEAPLLMAAMYFSSRFAVPQAGIPHKVAPLLGVGVVALIMQQAAEYILLRVNGQTYDEAYLAYLRSTPGMIYLALLFVFTLLPLAMWRRR